MARRFDIGRRFARVGGGGALAPRVRGFTRVETAGTLAALVAGVGFGVFLLGDDFARLLRQTDPTQLSHTLYVPGGSPADEVFGRELTSHLDDAARRRNDAEVVQPEQAASPEGSAAATIEEVERLLPELQTSGGATDRSSENGAAHELASPADGAVSRHSGERTLEYWNALNSIIQHEAAQRSVPAEGLTRNNAASYLAERGVNERAAADAIRGLSALGIDEEVLRLGEQLAAWYDEGADLAEHARYLMRHGDQAVRQGQTSQAWKAAEIEHHRRVDDLNRRGDEIRRRASQRYGLAFPPLK